MLERVTVYDITDTVYVRPKVNTVKAAEIAGVSPRTIYNWIHAGRVEAVQTAGGGVRVFVDTLFRAIERREAS